MKKGVLLGIAVLLLLSTACTQHQNIATAEENFWDFEPSQQILLFEDMRDGYYLKFAENPAVTMEWCEDTVVEQKALIVGVNPVSRVCLEADNRYYLD